MEFSDKQKKLLAATVELLWSKGANTPQQAVIAFEFTQFVEQVVKDAPKSEEKK